MKAIILAGGQGKRLKSISGDVPKPMVPLLGRPMMEYIVELLKKHGFTDICVAARYKHEQIEEHFGDGSTFGVKMQYRIENEPLGTAGAIKNCGDFYENEDFLVISGDAACDFDLSALKRVHEENENAVTVALHRNSSPTSYGLAVTDVGGYVRAFIEKPDWSRVVTDLVNTGIYIISPGAMSYVPPAQEWDMAKDLFPTLLGDGENILGCEMDGYWRDIGEPRAYYQCCLDALDGKLNIAVPPEFMPKNEDVSPDAAGEEYECGDRAALMGRLSRIMLDMGADFSDGIRLHRSHYDLHIFPSSVKNAVRVNVASGDSEFARELSVSAGELIRALENEKADGQNPSA